MSILRFDSTRVLLPVALLVVGGLTAQALRTTPGSQSDLAKTAARLAHRAVAGGVTLLRVEDLTDPLGQQSPMGRRLTADVARWMIEAEPRLTLCGREAVPNVLAEQHFQAQGLVKSNETTGPGGICGPDAILTGTLTPEEGQLRVAVTISRMDLTVVAVEEWTQQVDSQDLEALEPDPRPDSDSTSSTVDATALGLREQAGPFGFELHRCRFQEDYLHCVLTVDNLLPERRRLAIRPASAITDTTGSVYRVQSIHFGTRKALPLDGGKPHGTDLLGGGRLQVELYFTGMSRHKKKAHDLVLHLEDEHVVRFADFPLDRVPRD